MLTLLIVMYIGTLNKQLAICRVDSRGEVIGGQGGCYNLIPVFDWIRRCIVSIFLVFFIAFLPLFLQGAYPIFCVRYMHLTTLQNLLNVVLAKLFFAWGNISCLCRQSSKSSPRRSTPSPFSAILHLVVLDISPLVVDLRRRGYPSASYTPGSLVPVSIWE